MLQPETPLPEKSASIIFPYLKYSGGIDVDINDVFKIEDDAPVIGASYMNLPDGKEQKMEIIFKRVLPDCFLFYGFDMGMLFTQVMPSDLTDSLRLDNLHQVAKENLIYFYENEKKPEIRSSEKGMNMIVCGGSYEATLVLFEGMWLNFQEQLQNSLYIAVPARDVILFTTKDNLPAIDEIRNFVKQHYYSFGKQLSKYLYKMEGDIWSVAEKLVD
ncbi:DUF1444 domain-containing protein [Ferruginibacter sp.]